jgi:ribonuclease VapC
MFIDTSAVIAILADEPPAARLAETIAAAKVRLTSGLVRLEACMRLASKLGISPERAQVAFDAMIEAADITVVPVTDEIARLGVAAFAAFGKGRGPPARLKFADCLSYACAKAHATPLLFIGADFAQTDIAGAVSEE